jgi:hypothetical protein
MTGYTHQISIVPISNVYDNEPHDIAFFLNDIWDHFMVPNCWKKLFLIKRNHKISLKVCTAWHVAPIKISIESISNDYDNKPHDIAFLLNNILDHFMVANCWKKSFLIKRNHEISVKVGTTWQVTPIKSQ